MQTKTNDYLVKEKEPMKERKSGKETKNRASHVIPLNFDAGELGYQEMDIPIAACDCDGHCNKTNVCVIGDVQADVEACGVWG